MGERGVGGDEGSEAGGVGRFVFEVEFLAEAVGDETCAKERMSICVVFVKGSKGRR